jgi:hypothetical protein
MDCPIGRRMSPADTAQRLLRGLVTGPGERVDSLDSCWCLARQVVDWPRLDRSGADDLSTGWVSVRGASRRGGPHVR